MSNSGMAGEVEKLTTDEECLQLAVEICTAVADWSTGVERG